MTETTFMATEVATQPADWLAVADAVPRWTDALPRRGERVAVVGCGTSHYMAMSYSALREDAGHGVTDAFTASEHRLDRGYDRVLAITRSGTTTEVIDLLQRYRGQVPLTVITADPTSPVVDLASDPVVLAEVDERSVVQTRFATTTLALLRASLGHDLGPAAAQAEEVLAAPMADLAECLVAEQITFVGTGWSVGIAYEAALKLRESAQAWTEAYPAMEYRHGPISITAPGRAVWALGEVPPGLADDVRRTGGHFEHSGLDPMAELVRVHRVCLARARDLGLDPDVPRSLSRSIILDV